MYLRVYLFTRRQRYKVQGNFKLMNNSYTYKVAKIWNSLKIDLRQESLKTFVRKIGDIKF